jgi:hypothetical protein
MAWYSVRAAWARVFEKPESYWGEGNKDREYADEDQVTV